MILDQVVARCSSLPSYADCPRRWAARALPIADLGYDKPREVPRSIGAAIGSAVHAGSAAAYAQKMGGNSVGIVESVAVATEALSTDIASAEILWDTLSTNRSDGMKQVERMTTAYIQRVVPDVTPTAIEEQRRARFGRLTVQGQKDVLCNAGTRIHDIKTGRVRRQNLAQYGGYALLERTHGATIEDVAEAYVPRVAVGRDVVPQLHVEDAALAETMAVDVLREIDRAVGDFNDALEAGDARPERAFRANPWSALCSDKFCPAWGTKFCKEHKR